MHPKIDLLCLAHNSLKTTKGFVDHLYKNTQNFRISFLNNGSTDDTDSYLKNICSKYDNCLYFQSDVNLGVIRGRNFLAKCLFDSHDFINTPTDYFMNIDNDQYPTQDCWLQKIYDLMIKGYDIVGIDAWRLSKPGSTQYVVLKGQEMRDSSYFPCYHCSKKGDNFTYVGAGGCLIKKEVYDNIGLFDERYRMCYFEDPDLIFRSIQAGYKIGWLDNCPVKHLGHQTFNIQKTYDRHKEFLNSWREFKNRWYPYFPENLGV